MATGIAKASWDRANTVTYGIKLNRNTDAALIAKLESVGNKQGYIKQLIQEDLKKEEEKKMKSYIKIEHYINGSGYSYTEDIETIKGSVTAAKWWSNLDSDYAEGCMEPDGWIRVISETYADDAAPMVDDPVSASDYTPD